MNPLAQVALGSVLRWALAIGAGYLVQAKIWTDSEAATYVTAAALAILSLGWSMWQKYTSRRKLVVALTLPPTTEQVVELTIASGVALPAVTTPKDRVPKAPVW